MKFASWITATLLLLVSGTCYASADTYYSDGGKHGYYRYEVPPEEEKPAPRQKPKQVQKSEDRQVKERNVPSLKDFTPQELWDMYPDDLVALEEDFRKKAVQHPTRENTKEHLYIKDLQRRKALAYTKSYMLALQENPELNLEREFPIQPSAQAVMYKQNEKERRDKILASKDDFAIVYFSSQGCQYCDQQDKILSYFKGRNNWTIKKVDKDSNPGLVAKFGIKVTPTLILIKKGREDYLPVTTGVIALTELEERVFNGVKLMNNESTPENYSIREYQRGGAWDVDGPLPIK